MDELVDIKGGGILNEKHNIKVKGQTVLMMMVVDREGE